MSVTHKTFLELQEHAKKSDSVIVGFSGGKDSLVVLDLCRKAFKRVICFYMYLVPGLECIENQLEKARHRWGVEIHYYPHWLLFKCLKSGIYCDQSKDKDGMPELSLHDIFTIVQTELKIPLLATGAKDADSLWRRRFFKSTAHWQGLIYPIREWNKFDVLQYLKANRIEIPDASKGNATGIDLSTPSLLWLHDTYPDDFKKLTQWFPFAEAVVHRRKFYGVK